MTDEPAAVTLLIDSFDRVRGLVVDLTDSLPEEVASYRPDDEANSIGWLVWHLTRVQDIQVSALADRPQAWVDDGWAEKFGREANAQDVGFGKTPDEVSQFQPPDTGILLGYYRAVLARSKE